MNNVIMNRREVELNSRLVQGGVPDGWMMETAVQVHGPLAASDGSPFPVPSHQPHHSGAPPVSTVFNLCYMHCDTVHMCSVRQTLHVLLDSPV